MSAPPTLAPPERPVQTPEPSRNHKEAKADAKAAKAYAKAQRAWYQKKRFIFSIGAVLLVIISAAASGGGGSNSDKNNAVPAPGNAKSADDKGCGAKATNDCTPERTFSQRVKVDALNWNIDSVRTSKTLGDQTFGLGEKADGTFVIVKLGVVSDKNKSVTLTDDVVKLKTPNGNTYDADSDGTIAAIGNNENPFLFEDIGPDSRLHGTVVFDVPDTVLASGGKLRFGELGFGSTKGYIDLPASKLTS